MVQTQIPTCKNPIGILTYTPRLVSDNTELYDSTLNSPDYCSSIRRVGEDIDPKVGDELPAILRRCFGMREVVGLRRWGDWLFVEVSSGSGERGSPRRWRGNIGASNSFGFAGELPGKMGFWQLPILEQIVGWEDGFGCNRRMTANFFAPSAFGGRFFTSGMERGWHDLKSEYRGGSL
ncbi:hypothetical protein ACLOJK_038731 [Asimina triloba]